LGCKLTHARMVAVLCALAGSLAIAGTANAAADGGPGTVRLFQNAGHSFDRYTYDPSPSAREWMNAKYWRMRTYAPYFDSRLAWFPNAWTYRDLYAIYRDEQLAQEHPEWILRDAQGNKLYIPFDCGGGTCTQYAGDIGNPQFRAHWIDAASAQAAPYRGLFIDDVNMVFRVGDGAGQPVDPIDPRTGAPMTESDWRRYIAEFTEQIRQAMPSKEIVHNALWFAGHDDPYVQRELAAADYIQLERGVNDAGLTGGGGQFGLETFLQYVDWLQARGQGVVFAASAFGEADREYGLAGYFLISSGRDAIGNDEGATPDDWWPGYDVELGAPRGERYVWQGLLRRDFVNGYVLINQPQAPTQTIQLGDSARGPTGQPLPSATLAAAQGVVVVDPTGAPETPPRSSLR